MGESASSLISRKIAWLGDWRGKTLIREAIALNQAGKVKAPKSPVRAR